MHHLFSCYLRKHLGLCTFSPKALTTVLRASRCMLNERNTMHRSQYSSRLQNSIRIRKEKRGKGLVGLYDLLRLTAPK